MKQHSAVRSTQCPRYSIHTWASKGLPGKRPVKKTNADCSGFRGRISRMATHCSAIAAIPQRFDSVLRFCIAEAYCDRPIHLLAVRPRTNHRPSAYALPAIKGIAIQNLRSINIEFLRTKTGLTCSRPAERRGHRAAQFPVQLLPRCARHRTSN